MSELLSSAVNRIIQVQQLRETTLEAVAANADTGEVYRGATAAYQLKQGRFSAGSSSRRSRNGSADAKTPLVDTSTSANARSFSSANARLANIYDVDDKRERALFVASVTNRRRPVAAHASVPIGKDSSPSPSRIPSTMPNRRIPAWSPSKAQPDENDRSAEASEGTPSPSVPPTAGGMNYGAEERRAGHGNEPLLDRACPDAAEATVEAAEAIAAAVPFPLKAVLCIIASQLLSLAPVVIFASIAPYIYGILVGDLQTAGTVSSVAAGLSMMLQVLVTPVLAQVMDLYGRKKLAVFSCVKSVMVCLPLLVAGITIHEGQKDSPADESDVNARLGGYLPDGTKTFVHAMFVLYWILGLLASASNSAHCLVAIADVCQSQQHRCMAIGAFAGLANLLAAFAIIGSHFSMMLGGVVSVGVGAIGLIFTLVMMPETIDVSRTRGEGEGDTHHQSAKSGTTEHGSVIVAEKDFDNINSKVVGTPAMIKEQHTPQSSVARRLSIYPSEIRRQRAPAMSLEADGKGADTPPTIVSSGGAREVSRASDSSPAAVTIEFNQSRRIHVCASPFKGFALIRRSRSSVVALAVLFSCLMAEISASDTLVYYLSITMDFEPGDVSYLQIERAVLSLIVSAVVGPLLTKVVSCARQCMLCALFIAAALVVLAVANSKIIIFAVYVPCASMGSIMIPSIAAVITKDASSPEDVSLSMSTVMSLVALLQAGGSFFAALVFKMLSKDTLWITFVISAAFTLPMFVLSIVLEVTCNREEAVAKAVEVERAARAKELASPPDADRSA